MDVETYTKIYTQRGDDVNRAKMAFRKDLLRGKSVWKNRRCSDWHSYLRNNHPLYSLIAAPRHHPYNRKERVVSFIVSMGLAATLVMIGSLITGDIDLSTEATDPTTVSGDIQSGDIPESGQTAVTTSPDAEYEIKFFDYASIKPMDLLERQLIAWISGLIVALSDGLMKFMSECPCCQKNSCPRCCRKLFEHIGHLLMFIYAIMVIGLFVLYLLVLYPESEDKILFGWNVIEAELTSWFISSVLILTFKFCCCAWKKEKNNKKKILNKFKVTWVDYELYVKGEKQLVLPPDYEFKKDIGRKNSSRGGRKNSSRKDTIGSVGSYAESVGSASPYTPQTVTPVTPASPQTTGPQTVQVQMASNLFNQQQNHKQSNASVPPQYAESMASNGSTIIYQPQQGRPEHAESVVSNGSTVQVVYVTNNNGK